MKNNALTIVSGTGSSWKLTTPFGTVTRPEAGGYRHGIILGRSRLAEFKAKGRKSTPLSHFIRDNILFTFQGRFENGKPLFYPWRGI